MVLTWQEHRMSHFFPWHSWHSANLAAVAEYQRSPLLTVADLALREPCCENFKDKINYKDRLRLERQKSNLKSQKSSRDFC